MKLAAAHGVGVGTVTAADQGGATDGLMAGFHWAQQPLLRRYVSHTRALRAFPAISPAGHLSMPVLKVNCRSRVRHRRVTAKG